MTQLSDLEISEALALAIGWKKEQIHKNLFIDVLQVVVRDNDEWAVMQAFDYRDWNVIGPIAAKYDCFPCRSGFGDWNVVGTDLMLNSVWNEDTPQKAIALAVIGAEK